MKLIGLIGATAPNFFLNEFAPIIRNHGCAWYGWTIPIREETLPILKRQISEMGHFNLYGYSSSWPEGGYTKAGHKVEAKFVVKKEPISHLDTRKEVNECPEPERGIQGYDGYYLGGWEHGHGKHGNVKLPRKTWFAVANAQEKNLELSPKILTPWNPRHKIHPSALRQNFIEIVDDIPDP